MKLTALAVMLTAVLSVSQSDEIERLLSKYGEVSSGPQSSDFYRSLFAICQRSDLETLTSNRNDSIATQSAWEIVTLTVPTEEAPVADDRLVTEDRESAYRPDSKKLEWFIGFVEERNRVKVPDWWRSVVMDSRANRRNNIYPGEPKTQPYRRASVPWVKCPSNADVTEKEQVVTYLSGDDSIALPAEIIERTMDDNLEGSFSGAFTKDYFFFTNHSDVGFPHEVACVDRNSKNVAWKSEVKGCWWSSASGIHESWVTIVPTDDGRVFVFGSASMGVYAYAFDLASGETIFQFSSTY